MPRCAVPGSGWLRHVPWLSGRGAELVREVARRRAAGELICPSQNDLLRAFVETPWEEARVVILGQDPYPGPGLAHGLAFSVLPGRPLPPSLRNILNEVRRDVYADDPDVPLSGDLTRWARQGVLLLNVVCSVRRGAPRSHVALGWQEGAQAVLQALAARRRPMAFLLWGNDARAFAPLVTEPRHLVLQAAHPSPLAASRGFFGCGHFSKVNVWLAAQGKPGVVW